MNQSEMINELAAALAKAQGEMRAADKNCVNPHFKNRFADLSSIWDAIRDPLSKNGLAVMQYVDAMEGRGQVLVTMLTHSSGQWIRSILPLLMAKQDCQGLGSSLSYMRRYGLSALVGVVSDDEEDGNNASGLPPKPVVKPKKEVEIEPAAPVKKLTPEQIKEITEKLELCTQDCKDNYKNFIKTQWKTEDVNQLPTQSYNPIMNAINNNLKKQEMERKGE